MNIVITDWKTMTQGDLSPDVFEMFGNVTAYELTLPHETAERIKDADIVLCNKTPMTAEVLSTAENLKYIGLFATGYNNIDLDYTAAHGITVCNAGGYSTAAVAQHVFALLLSIVSRVEDYRRFTADGHWIGSDVFSPFCYPMTELCGKTLGIVGLGNIGKAVAKIARAFGMTVLCHTRTPRDVDGVECVSFDELLARADVISPHCPLNEQSAKLFDAAAFEKCKDGVIFVNTSRGGVVDEAALRQALECGKVGYAALDVLETEPMSETCPLRGAPRCVITPHVAWAPLETRRRLLDLVCENLRQYLAGTPQNVVR